VAMLGSQSVVPTARNTSRLAAEQQQVSSSNSRS